MPTVDEEILGLRTRYKRDNNLDYIPAILGDANGKPDDPTVPGYVWVRLQTSNGLSAPRRVLGPSGKAMSLKGGTAILLEYDKKGNLRVAEPDTLNDIAGGGNPIAQVVQPTTTTTPRLTQGSIETLRVIPSSPASLSVAVKGWNPIVSGTPYQFAGAQVDLTSYVPSSGNMRYAVIFVKSDYATTEVFASTARSTADVPLDSADIQECITAATAGSTPVWAIKLVGGQTAISQNDLDVDGIDLRQMVNTASGSGGGVTGPGSSTDRAIATWNGTGGTTLRNNALATIDSAGIIKGQAFIDRFDSPTISAGAASVTAGLLNLVSETGLTDDLDTLNGAASSGQHVWLIAAAAHTITVKHGTGNIALNGGADFVLSGSKSLELMFHGSVWSDVGAGGSSSGDLRPLVYNWMGL